MIPPTVEQAGQVARTTSKNTAIGTSEANAENVQRDANTKLEAARRETELLKELIKTNPKFKVEYDASVANLAVLENAVKNLPKQNQLLANQVIVSGNQADASEFAPAQASATVAHTEQSTKTLSEQGEMWKAYGAASANKGKFTSVDEIVKAAHASGLAQINPTTKKPELIPYDADDPNAEAFKAMLTSRGVVFQEVDVGTSIAGKALNAVTSPFTEGGISKPQKQLIIPPQQFNATGAAVAPAGTPATASVTAPQRPLANAIPKPKIIAPQGTVSLVPGKSLDEVLKLCQDANPQLSSDQILAGAKSGGLIK
jgi:hypothetical protein